MLIIVSSPGSPPRRMLELTALDRQAVVFDDLAPAIEALRSAYADEPAAGCRSPRGPGYAGAASPGSLVRCLARVAGPRGPAPRAKSGSRPYDPAQIGG
jgi:hypothetical protein